MEGLSGYQRYHVTVDRSLLRFIESQKMYRKCDNRKKRKEQQRAPTGPILNILLTFFVSRPSLGGEEFICDTRKSKFSIFGQFAFRRTDTRPRLRNLSWLAEYISMYVYISVRVYVCARARVYPACTEAVCFDVIDEGRGLPAGKGCPVMPEVN